MPPDNFILQVCVGDSLIERVRGRLAILSMFDIYESTEVQTLGAVLHVKSAALPCPHCVLM